MPYALLLIGAVLLVAGLRNTYSSLWELVRGDFTQQGGFLTWVAAIAVVGGVGYIPKLRSLSIAFMTLLLLVLVISNGGVFAKLQQFIQGGAGGNTPHPNGAGNIQGVVEKLSDVAANADSYAAIAANLGAIA